LELYNKIEYAVNGGTEGEEAFVSSSSSPYADDSRASLHAIPNNNNNN
jgi:hypothetical protein